MKRTILVISLIAILLLSSCGLPLRYTVVRGSGNLASRGQRISGITSVDLNGIGTLTVEQGDEEKLEITAEDNILDYLEIKVIGSSLSLGVQEFIDIYPTEEIHYYLTVNDLSSVEISGSGMMEMDRLETDVFMVEISGSGEVAIQDLNVDTLDAEISGSGEMEVTGDAGHQNLRISGSGSYDAAGLSSESSNVDISGSGSAVIWVIEDLRLDLSGSGQVEYFGSPMLNTNISGSGGIKSLGNK